MNLCKGEKLQWTKESTDMVNWNLVNRRNKENYSQTSILRGTVGVVVFRKNLCSIDYRGAQYRGLTL